MPVYTNLLRQRLSLDHSNLNLSDIEIDKSFEKFATQKGVIFKNISGYSRSTGLHDINGSYEDQNFYLAHLNYCLF